MSGIAIWIAEKLGISILRLAIYVGCFLLVAGGALTIRQHYVNLGWKKAITAVKKQDDKAAAAADKVDQKASVCTDKNGFWDVVSQGCKLEDDK